MKLPYLRRRRLLAFTLVELLVVLAIIVLLGGLAFPNLQEALLKARSVQCSGNLRAIGVAANLAAADNGGHYPEIDQAADSATPIYPAGGAATNLIGALGGYGITTNSIKCPIDVMNGSASSFTKYGSSYEWIPVFDDGVTSPTTINVGLFQIPVNDTRVRLCTDFLPIHHGKMNALYGDGHVVAR